MESSSPSRFAGLWYAIPLMTVWSIYLLAYWPGGMSNDSIDQWAQMLTFKFTDWHPAFHTLTNWLITRFWLSPATVVLTQIIALSVVLGWGLDVVRRFGAPRWMPWLAISFFAFMPSTGLMVIMLWKDVFYSISVVAFTVLIFKITMTEGMWIQQPAAWACLGVFAALVALYRQNGPIVAFGTLLCLLIVYQAMWKYWAFALVLAFIIWMGIRGPVYDWVGVHKTSSPGVEIAFTHLIARYTNSDTLFSLEERSLLRRIRPGENWPYNCYMEGPLFFDGKFNFTASMDRDLAILSAKLIYRNPKVFLEHLTCNSSFIFQITQPSGSKYETTIPYIIPNQLGLVSESKLPGVKILLDHWTSESLQSFNWIIWRVPFWEYLLLAGVIIYGVRSKNWKAFLVLVPILANMLPLAGFTAGQAFRYVFSTMLVSVLMSGFYFFKGVTQDD